MEDLEEDLGGLSLTSGTSWTMIVGDTHKLINSKDTTKNPFPLKIHEIILGLLILGPSWGAFEKLECCNSVPKLYALFFQRNDGFRGIRPSGR